MPECPNCHGYYFGNPDQCPECAYDFKLKKSFQKKSLEIYRFRDGRSGNNVDSKVS